MEVKTKKFSIFVLASKEGKYPATGETNSSVPFVMGIFMVAGGAILFTKRKQEYIQ